MNDIYKKARLKANLTLEKAAELMHCNVRTVWAHENEKYPDAYYVSMMAEIYNKPELNQYYCKNHCPIGMKLRYELLDNVDLNVTTVLSKLRVEMIEAQEVMDDLINLSINDSFNDDLKLFEKGFQELLDVEHNILTLRLSVNKWIDIKKSIATHNKKCVDRNYTKKEKTPCKAN